MKNKFEIKTMIFDFIMILVYIVIGLLIFDVITSGVILKAIIFAGIVVAIHYFGCYRNHNYTAAAFEAQGELNIKKGKLKSNTETTEQYVEIEEGKMVG